MEYGLAGHRILCDHDNIVFLRSSTQPVFYPTNAINFMRIFEANTPAQPCLRFGGIYRMETMHVLLNPSCYGSLKLVINRGP